MKPALIHLLLAQEQQEAPYLVLPGPLQVCGFIIVSRLNWQKIQVHIQEIQYLLKVPTKATFPKCCEDKPEYRRTFTWKHSFLLHIVNNDKKKQLTKPNLPKDIQDLPDSAGERRWLTLRFGDSLGTSLTQNMKGEESSPGTAQPIRDVPEVTWKLNKLERLIF